MLHYVLVILFALAGSLAVCKMVSAFSPDGETAEPLNPISWVLCTLLFIGANVGMFALGWPWLPVIILGLILTVTIVGFYEQKTAAVFWAAAVPFTVTAILCFAKQADKKESPKALWLVAIPTLSLIAIFAISSIKSMPKKRRKEVFTIGNILSAVLILAAIISAIVFVKEVLLK